MEKDKVVELINNIIYESVAHGADCGGSYDSNEEGIIKRLKEAIVLFNLEQYEVGIRDCLSSIGNYGDVPALVLKN